MADTTLTALSAATPPVPNADYVYVVQAGASRKATVGELRNSGPPSAESNDRALTDNDDGRTLVCAAPRIFTLNTGLIPGFGCAFKGTVSFAGSATISDARNVGSITPWCAVVAIDTDTYEIVGGTL